MKTVFLIFLLVFYINASEFCVATYNVENLFDAKNDGTEYDDYKLSKYGWSKEEAENKLKNVARVVRDVESSIVALQEVENEAVLIRLKNELGFSYHAFAKNSISAAGLGFLSNYEIVKVEKFSLKGYDKFRPLLHVKVKFESGVVSFWINHFPSLQNKERMRNAYANSLRHYLTNNGEETYILLGDFNALDFENSALGRHFKDKVNNLWLELSPKNRWSYVYKGQKNILDYILPSNDFFQKDSKIRYIDGSFEPFKRRYFLNSKGRPKGNFAGFSDHLPLRACFEEK